MCAYRKGGAMKARRRIDSAQVAAKIDGPPLNDNRNHKSGAPGEIVGHRRQEAHTFQGQHNDFCYHKEVIHT